MEGVHDWKQLFTGRLSDHGYSGDEVADIYRIEMELRGFFDFDGLVPACLRLQNIQREEGKVTYFWESASVSATCPHCKAESSSVIFGDYYVRCIQDVPQGNKAVFHEVRSRKYICHAEDCPIGKFVERFYDFTDEHARKSTRFKKYCAERALGAGCSEAEREIRAEGGVVSNDSIGRYAKEKSAGVLEEKLKANDVKVLAIDDINLRKGDKSTACTVFVDQEKRKVLIIIRGTNKEAADKVMELFSSAEFLSRDRATAYASAGAERGLIQCADRFHLIDNAQDAVKNALMASIPADIFIRNGDGWALVEQESGMPGGAAHYRVPEQTIEDRVSLAGLSEKKAQKYRETLKMIELDSMGLRTADIAKELNMPYSKVQSLRRKAVSTIAEVEEKINKRAEGQRGAESAGNALQAPGENAEKTVGGPRVQSSEKSIVEPYRETVIKLWKEGGNHRTIYPVLQAEGYTGSKNAIYQYILKLGKEMPDEMIRKCKQTTTNGDFDIDKAAARPELSLERVARHSVYKAILKEASSQRANRDEALAGETQAVADGGPAGNNDANKCGARPESAKTPPLDEAILREAPGQRANCDEALAGETPAVADGEPAGNNDASKCGARPESAKTPPLDEAILKEAPGQRANCDETPACETPTVADGKPAGNNDASKRGARPASAKTSPLKGDVLDLIYGQDNTSEEEKPKTEKQKKK